MNRAFIDNALAARGTVIKAVHVTELRDRIDVLRRLFGLENFRWTETIKAGVTEVKAIHVEQLRTALKDADFRLAAQ